MSEVIYKEESYQVIGKYIEVHNQLGAGFLEVACRERYPNKELK
jgi:hypothetical protein